MWEFCLYFEQEQLDYILNLYKHLKRFFKKRRGVVIFYKEDQRLLFAIEDDEKNLKSLYSYIYNNIVNIIYTYYKRKAIDSLNADLFNDKYYETVVKEVLFCFDKEFDENYIKLNLVLYDTLNIEGFYTFRLAYLRDKWNNLVNIIKNNNKLLKDYEINLEFTRYLISELDNNIDNVCIFCEGNKYYLKNSENENIVYKKKNYSKKQNFEDLLKSIIILSPKSISLCCDIKKEYLKVLNDIFINKIK